jgi:hypothetical protein
MFWAIAALAAFVLHGLPIVGSLLPRGHELRDFFQEWASARNWQQGRDLYAPHRQTVHEYLHRKLEAGEIEVNAHPPPAVLLALPLAWLDYPTALQVWNLLSACLIAGGAWVVARELRLELGPASAAPLVVFFCSNPMRAQFDQGRLNAVLLALLTAGWYWERRGAGWASGAAVGAAAIKLFPAYLLLYFVCRRNGRALIGSLLGGLTMAGSAWLLFGTRAYTAYVAQVLPQVEGWRLSGLNASWHGFWLRLFGPEGTRFIPFTGWPIAAELLAAAGCLAVSTAAGLVTWRAASDRQRSRAWAACMTAMLLCSPITWDHYFVLLLLPWAEAWLASRPCWRQRWALNAASLSLWVNPALLWSAWYGRDQMMHAMVRPVESLLLFSLGFYALLILSGILAWPGVVARQDRDANVGQSHPSACGGCREVAAAPTFQSPTVSEEESCRPRPA